MPFPNLLDFEQRLQGSRVLVTGHTGFTGSWLTTWLNALGASVSGFALPPATTPNLYEALSLAESVTTVLGDINIYADVASAIDRLAPEIIFHLAAQPLVSVGYDEPLNTFGTNVMGTLHVLEAARNCPQTRAVVCITTDKVYLNRETHEGYREGDRLGGKDPYSASKACAEIVASAYVQTMAARGNDVAIATARGGNIIGGGDWSRDRIIPDYVRAKADGKPLLIRNPESTRPFQHVMSLVHGYMLLGSHLLQEGRSQDSVWNFGPTDSDAQTVRKVVQGMARHWDPPEIQFGEAAFPEATFLHLDSTKAQQQLRWYPPFGFDETIALTANWYRDFYADPAKAHTLTTRQIAQYREKLS